MPWEIIEFFERYTLALNFLALAIYVVCVRKKTAFVYVVSALFLIEISHQYISIYLRSFFGMSDYQFIIRTAWYMSFAFTDIAYVFCMALIINKKKLIRDRASDYVLIGYLLLAGLQIARYADRVLLETDALGSIYKMGVPFINVGISVILMAFAARLLYIVFSSRILLLINR